MWNHLKTQAEFIIKTIYPERVQNIQKRKYIKRKLSSTENENKSKQKRLKVNSQDNSIETLHETSGDTRLPTSISKTIELFHKNISVGLLDQNTFVRVVTSCGIGRLSLNVMLLYMSRVQEKFSIYALLVSKALTILNGYVVHATRT